MRGIDVRLAAPRAAVPPWGGTGSLATLIQCATMAHAAYDRYRQFREEQRTKRSYVVRIDEQDDLYLPIQTWLLDRIPRRDQRSLMASTETTEDGGVPSCLDDDNGIAPSLAVRYRYSGKESLTTRVDGHPMRIWVDRGEGEGVDDDSVRRVWRRPEQIVFEAESQAGLRTIMGVIETIAKEQAPRRGPRVYVASKWGHWERSVSLSARDPRTVVLAAGQMERLDAALQRFLASEDRYTRIGIPWHQGFLFEGPPGTGKTSAARALASLHGLDVYYLSLPGMESDTDLVRLLSNIPNRSVLLIEDVDGAHAAISREDNGPNRISMSALLNALDGVITPHGLVFMLTTNDVAALDPALIRRCDVREQIDYLTDEQMARLVEVMTGKTGPLPALNGRAIAPYTLVQIVKDHIGDMDQARTALVNFLAADRPGHLTVVA